MKFKRRKAAGLAAALALSAALALAANVTPAAAQTHPVPSGTRPASIGPGRPLSSNISVQTAQVCAKVAAKAGFSFNNYISTNDGSYPVIVVAVAVGAAESYCNPSFYLCNPSLKTGNYPPVSCDPGDTSYDRGLWAINSSAHSEVSDACAFQAQCNADAAFTISGKGYDWSMWDTYTKELWTNYISVAEQAIQSFTFQLRSNGDGTCLDADSTDVGNGGKIFQWDCNSSDAYQLWEVTDIIGHLPLLENLGTGTCLDADGTDSGNGAPIFQWTCNSTDSHQQWWFYGSGDMNTNGDADAGVHSQGNGTCLDADGTSKGNGAPIFQWTCNQSDIYQQWN
jgi:Ricin-type beta-trefoil lectin domain/Lysozyme like domain